MGTAPRRRPLRRREEAAALRAARAPGTARACQLPSGRRDAGRALRLLAGVPGTNGSASG